MLIPDYQLRRAELKAWRPSLRGDPESEDVMAFYSAVFPTLSRGAELVEIGVAHGRTLLWAAAELVRLGNAEAVLFAVDPWRFNTAPPPGHSSVCFPDAMRSLTEHGSFEELQLVRLLRIPSVRAAALWGESRLDGVFIDGDHSWEGCASDIDFYAPLVKAGGYFAGHDYTDQFPGVVKAVDQAFRGRHVLRGTVWAVSL